MIQMNIYTDTFQYEKLDASGLVALLRLSGLRQLLGCSFMILLKL